MSTKPKQVTSLYKSSASADKIVLKWSEVEGAEGYRICLYDEKTKKYTLIGTTKTCAYSMQKLDAGTEYTVCVAAYVTVDGKLLIGSYSSNLRVATKPTAVTGVKQTGQTENSITISWTGLQNATGYRVYCYDVNGNFLRHVDTTNTKCTINNVEAGKYIYRVRACIKTDTYTEWGYYSAELNVSTRPKQVTGLYKSSAAANKMVIKWNEVKGAEGYRICLYDEKTKKYTLVGTSKTCAYSMLKLQANTEYTIRVPAYTTVDGKLVIGTYSSSLVAKTNK